MPTIAVNKRAKFDYEPLETFEGGLALTGAEVKSAKAGRMQLQGAFLHLRGGELWLKGSHIALYAPAGPQPSYDPARHRKVLMHRREIKRLIGKTQQQGLTLVPVSVYTRGNLLKIEFMLGRGKKKYEKRETIKKRELKRQLATGNW